MIIAYIHIAILLGMPTLGLILHFVLYILRPQLIPKAKINKLAAEYIEKFGDNASEQAHQNETQAWHNGHPYERAKYKRIRKAIHTQLRK